MMVSDKEYVQHKIFIELSDYIDHYENLSDSIFLFPKMGLKAVCNIDTYVFSSMKGTLESIHMVLKAGKINDAYALLRKYHDSAVINIYTNLYLQDNFSLENFIVEKINNWVKGKEQLPEYRVMSQYIRKNPAVKDINLLINSDDKYKEVRDRCNDHTHYNFFKNAMLNDSDIYIKERLDILTQLSEDIKDLFIFHLSYAFTINDHYMVSSDYVDFLDCGMSPPENSQYWVQSSVQDIFDKIIKPSREDIASLIKENTSMWLS